MKQLGIFGDSYAELHDTKTPTYATGWTYKLWQEYGSDCGVHAGAGSSNPYNFRQFLEHHHKYKQVVFIVTSLHRVSIPVNATNKETGELEMLNHFPNISNIEYFIKNYDVEDNLAKKILDYMVYISYPLEQNLKDAHMASIHYIRHLRPDAIIIPAFPDCGIDTEYNWCLTDLDVQETHEWFTDRGKEKWFDPRANHFTPDTNNWMLAHVKGRLRGEFIDWNPSLTPSFKTKEAFDAALSSSTN